MKLEFVGYFRTKRDKTDEEKLNDSTHSLINPEYMPDKEITEYKYLPVVFDINDVISWRMVDKSHTQIDLTKNRNFTVKFPHIHFCKIFEDLTQQQVKVVEITKEPIRVVEGSLSVEEDEEE